MVDEGDPRRGTLIAGGAVVLGTNLERNSHPRRGLRSAEETGVARVGSDRRNSGYSSDADRPQATYFDIYLAPAAPKKAPRPSGVKTFSPTEDGSFSVVRDASDRQRIKGDTGPRAPFESRPTSAG